MAKSVAQYLDQEKSLGIELYIGSQPPPNPVDGSLWYDTVEKRLKGYKKD